MNASDDLYLLKTTSKALWYILCNLPISPDNHRDHRSITKFTVLKSLSNWFCFYQLSSLGEFYVEHKAYGLQSDIYLPTIRHIFCIWDLAFYSCWLNCEPR